jgi:hypothetical protein
MKNKVLNKIKNLFNYKKPQEVIEKMAALDHRITLLEKANLVILSRLLQMSTITNANNSKITDKSNILLTSPKDYNEGKDPTYH